MARLGFRQLHRKLSLIIFLPLALTAVTGVAYQVATSWFHLDDDKMHFLMDIHAGNFRGLEKIYPVLNGLGVIGLIVTGLTMTGLFRSRPKREAEGE